MIIIALGILGILVVLLFLFLIGAISYDFGYQHGLAYGKCYDCRGKEDGDEIVSIDSKKLADKLYKDTTLGFVKDGK